ncbi:MAG: hypothetical protein MJ007_05275 [Paludibacteraceae bacterium]|nr:hypothetical protein [Paludibacteraceae bacterium]
MTESASSSIKNLTDKVSLLLQRLDNKDKYITQITNELSFLKEELKKANAENVELQKKYNNLKIAKSVVSLSKGDVSQARKKLTDIMAQIDVCIAKLSN